MMAKLAHPSVTNLIDVLTLVVEYFDQRADADEPSPGHQIANEEMRLMTMVQTQIECLAPLMLVTREP